MKKRLLITSIVMMLVVAVALSTATYAWFTSSAAVTATNLTMTAAVNDDAALEINYVNTEGAWLSTIAATSPVGGFKPAAPNVFALPVADDPEQEGDSSVPGTYLAAITWKNQTVKNGKFDGAGEGNQEYIWQNDDDPAKTSIFLHNASTANAISNITLTATIGGDAAPFIRIAVFKKDSTVAAGNFELIGVISNLVNYTKATTWSSASDEYFTSTNPTATAVTYESQAAFDAVAMKYTKTTNYQGVTYGDVTDGKAISTMGVGDYCTASVALGRLAVNNNAAYGADEMEIKIVVWMDGAALNDDTAGSVGKEATIALNFAASR